MKNNTLVYILIGAGAYYLIASKKKKPAYKITVPPPEKITAEQFAKPSLIKRTAPVAKTIFSLFKKKPTSQQQATAAALSKGSILQGVGQFPDMC